MTSSSSNIILPGYEIYVPNAVYGRVGESLPLEDSDRILTSKEIICLNRFRVPTTDEFREYMQRIASINLPFFKEKPAAYQRLKDMSDGKSEILENIVNMNELKEYIKGEWYLHSITGLLPDEVLDSHREELKKAGVEGYEFCLKDIGAMTYGLKIRIENDKRLPNRQLMNLMLNEGVTCSRIVGTFGDYIPDYDIVIDRVDMFYKSLNSPEKISNIQDYSSGFLNLFAKSAIKRIIVPSLLQDEIPNIVEDALKEVEKMGKKKLPTMPFNKDAPKEQSRFYFGNPEDLTDEDLEDLDKNK